MVIPKICKDGRNAMPITGKLLTYLMITFINELGLALSDHSPALPVPCD